ncbi:hypothetical protein REPUB_Repub15cG0115000 [Reevesia pubescens]
MSRFVVEYMAIIPKTLKPGYVPDEKDLKIRELSIELHREKKKSAAYQEQLQMVLKHIEEHTQRLSLKVDAVSNNLRELESEDQDSSFSD